jgi:hypothetical protein
MPARIKIKVSGVTGTEAVVFDRLLHARRHIRRTAATA